MTEPTKKTENELNTDEELAQLKNEYANQLIEQAKKTVKPAQKWGVRAHQNADGTLTDEAKKRYGVVTETDENGKPVAGRYPYGEDLVQQPAEPILDIDVGKEAVHLTPEQAAQVKTKTLRNLVRWMKEHPKSDPDTIHQTKLRFRNEAVMEIVNTHAKHEQ